MIHTTYRPFLLRCWTGPFLPGMPRRIWAGLMLISSPALAADFLAVVDLDHRTGQSQGLTAVVRPPELASRRVTGLGRSAFLEVSGGGVENPEPSEEDPGSLLKNLGRAGPDSPGTPEMANSREKLVRLGSRVLPQVLQAMDTPNIVAANWYRTVFDDIAAKELAAAQPVWPLEDFKAFVQMRERQGRARRLVLDLLERIEPGYREKLLPTLLDDSEFRQEAVDFTLQAGDRANQSGDKELAKRKYREGFLHARESTQVLAAASKLHELGETVDPIRRLGFVTRWSLIGPFDAPGLTGFDTQFPPENQVDPEATYVGQDGSQIGWKVHETKDPLGEVNLIAALGPVREAVAYAVCDITVAREQSAQLRCSADDNLQVWLNGRQVLARRQWLNGTRLDRFSQSVTLSAGTNRLLVKICQGPQHVNPDVPNNWTFQLRLCDDSGAGIEMTHVFPQEAR